jgi:ornithine cyclodeaminase/alanine dehydrogenase-like protein (mu-crystallin family)
LIDEGHILGEVGDVLAGRVEGRPGDSDVTLFKSVGCAAEDCLAAEEVLARAKALGVGDETALI